MKKIVLGIIVFLATLAIIPNVNAAPTGSQWSTIVTKLTNSSIVSDLKSKGAVVTSDSSTMTITIKANEQLSSPVTLKYYYSNEIISFISTNVSNNPQVANYEMMINEQLLASVAEYLGYDATLFKKWISEVDNTKLTIGNDGIEFTKYTASAVQNGTNVTVDAFKTLKVNIVCGISSYKTTPEPTPNPTPTVTPTPEPTPNPTPTVTPTTPEQETVTDTKVENPQTGIYVSVALIEFIIVAGITLLMLNRKNYFREI